MKLRRLKEKPSGFTLVELLIVVIILGILAAVVIPQFGNSTSEAKVSALDANLATLRSAVELYQQQHGHLPGSVAASGGTAPGSGGAASSGAINTAAAVRDQLTMYTNSAGQAVTTSDSAYKYGPYLKKGIPKEPVSDSDAIEIVTAGVLNMSATGATTGGWKYDVKTGQIIANMTAHQGR